ncbi:MAG: hypothetical protein JKY33_04545 [Bacteroidia bacterium]|nr:hypothetical protein [Bacteroidia bacterium]
MKNLKLAFIAIFFTSILFYACEKEEQDDNSSTDTETSAAADNSTAENYFSDIFSMVDDAAKTDEGTGKTGRVHRFGRDTLCATVTVDPAFPDTTFPKTITIDFGDSNCVGSDGRTRRGQILASLTGRYRELGTVVTVTFNNFYINDNQILGTKTVTNNGYNADSNLTYTVDVIGAKIISAEGDTISWESTRTNEWVEGDDTPDDIWDDVYHITGSGSGVNRKGVSFTMSITQELRKEIGCKWLVSGIVEITPDGKLTRTIDFGDGTCDDKATVSVGNFEKEITLR